ncbi:AIM24 family protein [Nitrosopumilus sp.]|uniref:AIM24 family protein n=1 Tax=Nitrosopumilus sp. TaxID=2024843 RepID=UPI00292CEFE6|nr:AIM24 family protein [Nitrosopumilus sp.]
MGLTGNMLGDIESIPTEQEMIIQSGAYVASIGDITLDTQWQGFKRGIFGSSLFMLKTVGTGEIFVNAYGGIIQKELKEDETMTIETTIWLQ